MKHLKTYKIEESVISDIESDITDSLLDLIDDNWLIDVRYIPKRWENTSANYYIKNDHIMVFIRKQNSRYNRYPKGSEFKLSDVNEYILRLVDMFNSEPRELSNKVTIRYCNIIDNDNYSDNPARGMEEIPGNWTEFKEVSNDDINGDRYILALEMRIDLDGENLDNFNYHNENMKHLKTFESLYDIKEIKKRKHDFKSLLYDCQDILMELHDDDYTINVVINDQSNIFNLYEFTDDYIPTDFNYIRFYISKVGKDSILIDPRYYGDQKNYIDIRLTKADDCITHLNRYLVSKNLVQIQTNNSITPGFESYLSDDYCVVWEYWITYG